MTTFDVALVVVAAVLILVAVVQGARRRLPWIAAGLTIVGMLGLIASAILRAA